jgi:hypothetical protein
VQQLRNYDDAFGKFFDRLAASGINKSNTLFVFTVEEGDHFAGSQPTNPGCNGVIIPCTYPLTAAGDRFIGEINGNLTGLLATQQGITTPFTVHSDMAPTIYINGNPARTDAVTRNFGRALGQLTATNLYTNQSEKLAAALADPVGMGMLHMITADPQRTPTLTLFAAPDYFLFTGAANCNSPCLTVPTTPPSSTFAWNHGGIQPEIATTWMGFAGPGVRPLGQDDQTWLDHTDVRPTMLSLLGLSDTYVHDGRVLFGNLEESALPATLRGGSITIRNLADTYKQLTAPFGQVGQETLMISTAAIASNAAGDATYANLSSKLINWRAQRDVLANKMRAVLDAAAFAGQAINEPRAAQYVGLAQTLINEVSLCAADVSTCAK